MVSGVNLSNIELTNEEWEGVAAALQHRVLAIYHIASSKRRKSGVRFREIRDLCGLPFTELVKKGLISDNHHRRK